MEIDTALKSQRVWPLLTAHTNLHVSSSGFTTTPLRLEICMHFGDRGMKNRKFWTQKDEHQMEKMNEMKSGRVGQGGYSVSSLVLLLSLTSIKTHNSRFKACRVLSVKNFYFFKNVKVKRVAFDTPLSPIERNKSCHGCVLSVCVCKNVHTVAVSMHFEPCAEHWALPLHSTQKVSWTAVLLIRRQTAGNTADFWPSLLKAQLCTALHCSARHSLKQ